MQVEVLKGYKTMLSIVNHINSDQLAQIYDLLDNIGSETPSTCKQAFSEPHRHSWNQIILQMAYMLTFLAVLWSYSPTLGMTILRKSQSEL